MLLVPVELDAEVAMLLLLESDEDAEDTVEEEDAVVLVLGVLVVMEDGCVTTT